MKKMEVASRPPKRIESLPLSSHLKSNRSDHPSDVVTQGLCQESLLAASSPVPPVSFDETPLQEREMTPVPFHHDSERPCMVSMPPQRKIERNGQQLDKKSLRPLVSLMDGILATMRNLNGTEASSAISPTNRVKNKSKTSRPTSSRISRKIAFPFDAIFLFFDSSFSESEKPFYHKIKPRCLHIIRPGTAFSL
ncbi:hypothetical protein CPB84DRAFT_1772480, partial [Gymnopilus junonius]